MNELGSNLAWFQMTQARVAEMTLLSRTACDKAILQMVQADYIKRVECRNAGKRFGQPPFPGGKEGAQTFFIRKVRWLGLRRLEGKPRRLTVHPAPSAFLTPLARLKPSRGSRSR